MIKELDEKKKQALRTAWDQVEDSIKQSFNYFIVQGQQGLWINFLEAVAGHNGKA